MRPIKFRAWDASEKELVGWGALIHDPDNWFNTMLLDVHEDKSDVLMQYTGLKDKNGVEIYEGDIVSIKGETCEVLWNESGGAWKYTGRAFNPGLYKNDGVEVIGNIYENPELLEANQ